MRKDFWIKCLKRFLTFTIPALIALLTIFSFFSSKFEDSLRQIGILGAVFVLLFFFLLTLLYGINEMINVVDFVSNEYIQDSNLDTKNIYKLFTVYQSNIKIQKSEERNDTHKVKYKYTAIEFYNKYLKVEDVFLDTLQEISFISLAGGLTSISDFFKMQITANTPKSLPNINVEQLKKSIETEYTYNVMINFYGKIEGCILLCFSAILKSLAYKIIKDNNITYNSEFNKLVNALLYELGSLYTASFLTNLYDLNTKSGLLSWDEQRRKVLNFKIRRNLQLDRLEIHNYVNNIYAVKLNGLINEDECLFTSYIFLDNVNAEKLVNRCLAYNED